MICIKNTANICIFCDISKFISKIIANVSKFWPFLFDFAKKVLKIRHLFVSLRPKHSPSPIVEYYVICYKDTLPFVRIEGCRTIIWPMLSPEIEPETA